MLAGGFATFAPRARAAASLLDLPLGFTGMDHVADFAKAGFGFLELGFSALCNPREDEASFRKNEEKVKALALPARAMNGFLPGGEFPITGPAPKHDAIVEWAKVGFERAKRLGIEVVTIGSGGARKIPDGFEHEKASAQFAELLGRLGPVARDAGVKAAIENLNRGETNLGNTVEECVRLVRASGSNEMKVTVDVYHMLRENEGPEAITAAGELVIHTHWAEKEKRSQPGHAGDDFRPYLKAFAAIGYKGLLSFECGWKGGEPAELAGPSAKAFRAQMAG